jgi:cystathionine gamma-synthase
MKFETKAVHAGEIKDATARSVTNPIYLSTTFEREQSGELSADGFVYTRSGNPNRTALETKFAVLEQGVEAIAYSSGMAASLAVFHAVLEPGAHIIVSDDCYHGVAHMAKKIYPRWNVSYDEVDMTHAINVEKAVRPNTKLILVETPSNPQLKIADIEAISGIAKKNKIVLACDNTWATPCIIQPLKLGADLVIHSSTKYFGGHSDVLGGCVVTKVQNEISERLREFQTIGGVVPSPFDCWLLFRSIATLPIRIKVQAQSAAIIAEMLNKHPKIEKVFYPGLKIHVNHDVAARQMKGSFGAMLSVLVKGGEKGAMDFAGRLKVFKHATSLGGVESLVEHRLSAEGENAKSPDNLMRISIGIEHIDDLLSDLEQALA